MSAALAYPINDITRPDAANDNAGLHQTLNDRLLLESLFSSGSLIHIRKHTDNVRTDYIKGPMGTVARVTGGVVTYLHPDGCIYCETKIARLGSAQAGTKQDGTIDWREQYTPFGEQLQNPAANDNLDGFTGHIKDKATGLNYMQARYYDPVIGRFLSIDPVTFMDTGVTAQFNRYSYTANDPINWTDPNGECPWCVVGAIVSAGIDIAIQKNTGDGTINWAQVGVSAGAGFVGVGIASKVATLSKGAAAAVSAGTRNPTAVAATVHTTTQAVSGGAVNVVAGGATRAVDGDVNTTPVDGMAAMNDFVAGTVGAGVGDVVGEGLGAAAKAANLPKLGLGAKTQITNLGRTIGKVGSDIAAAGTANRAQSEMTSPCQNQENC